MGSYTPDTPPVAEDNGLDIPEPTQTLHQILTQSVRQYPKERLLYHAINHGTYYLHWVTRKTLTRRAVCVGPMHSYRAHRSFSHLI